MMRIRRALLLAAAGAVTLLSFLPAAQAHKAVITNHCTFPIFAWSVAPHDSDKPPVQINGSTSYHEPYRWHPHGGISIKIGRSPYVAAGARGTITQLEYNNDLSQHKVYYDVSNVDCQGKKCPFWNSGMYLESGSECPTVRCRPGDIYCDEVYNLPNDHKTLACESSQKIILHVCVEAEEKPHFAPKKDRELYGNRGRHVWGSMDEIVAYLSSGDHLFDQEYD